MLCVEINLSLSPHFIWLPFIWMRSFISCTFHKTVDKCFTVHYSELIRLYDIFKCSISHIDIERVNKFDAQVIFIVQRKKAIHFSDLSMWHGVVAPRNFQICFMLWNDKRHKINVKRSTNGDLCYATATPNSLSARSKIMKKKVLRVCCLPNTNLVRIISIFLQENLQLTKSKLIVYWKVQF